MPASATNAEPNVMLEGHSRLTGKAGQPRAPAGLTAPIQKKRQLGQTQVPSRGILWELAGDCQRCVAKMANFVALINPVSSVLGEYALTSAHGPVVGHNRANIDPAKSADHSTAPQFGGQSHREKVRPWLGRVSLLRLRPLRRSPPLPRLTLRRGVRPLPRHSSPLPRRHLPRAGP